MEYSELNELLNSGSNGDAEAALAVLGVFIVFILIFSFIALIFRIISRWIFFKKCGKEGWRSLIPIYTDFTLVEIAGLNWWWILIIYASSICSSMQSYLNVVSNSNDSAQIGVVTLFASLITIVAGIAGLIAKISQSINIAKRFNKGTGYAILIIFFEPIMLLVLGLSKNAQYDSSIEVSPNGIFGNKTSSFSSFCPDCGAKVNGDFCPNCGKKVR